MNRKSLLAVTIAGLLVGGLPSLAMAETYNVTILDSLGGTASEADGINDAGQVVGYSRTAGNTQQAVISNDTRIARGRRPSHGYQQCRPGGGLFVHGGSQYAGGDLERDHPDGPIADWQLH